MKIKKIKRAKTLEFRTGSQQAHGQPSVGYQATISVPTPMFE